MTVVIVGSGLAAVGSIRAAIERGLRPIVLDIGLALPHELKSLKSKLAKTNPADWTEADWDAIRRNDSNRGRLIPRKLVLGSDYFYSSAEPKDERSGASEDCSPPESGARGGFSVGWGAAVLPPAISDLKFWPITHQELIANMRSVTHDLQISEPTDVLSQYFGTIRGGDSTVLALNESQKKLLNILTASCNNTAKEKFLVGQSRLLTDARSGLNTSCRLCGMCSSGCVYDSIYTAERDIDRWVAENKIDYRSGLEVTKVEEKNNCVTITYVVGEKTHCFEADKVYLAAGAMSTTRIMVNSAPLDIQKVRIRRTGGMILVYAGPRHYKINWPNTNTQTSHVVEMLSPDISPHWVHIQVGQPNELLLQRIGLSGIHDRKIIQRMTKGLAAHLVTAVLNTNSEYGPQYELDAERSRDGRVILHCRQSWTEENQLILKKSTHRFSKFMKRSGFLRVPFASQDSLTATGFHLGSSFPMTLDQKSALETDVLGRPFGWQRVYLVDTSVLPSIPSTGIGISVLANSYRIASETL